MLKGFTVPKSPFGQAALMPPPPWRAYAAHTRWRAGCDHNDGTSSVPSKNGAGKATSFVVANFLRAHNCGVCRPTVGIRDLGNPSFWLTHVWRRRS